EVAGKLVVVEQHPAQDFELLVFRAAAELARAFGEIREDHTALGEPLALVLEDRHFTLLVDVAAEAVGTRLAVEIIDGPAFPIAAAEAQHQRRLVRVARFPEAIQAILSHRSLLTPWQVAESSVVRESAG